MVADRAGHLGRICYFIALAAIYRSWRRLAVVR